MKSSEFLGIIGTIIGVILGYILNSISRIGKIKPLFHTITREYIGRDNSGAFITVKDFNSTVDHVKYIIKLNFYNSSQKIKNIQSIFLIFRYKESKKEFIVKPAKEQIEIIDPGCIQGNANNFFIKPSDFQLLDPSQFYFAFKEISKIRKYKLKID
jgi:hypothetical protein